MLYFLLSLVFRKIVGVFMCLLWFHRPCWTLTSIVVGLKALFMNVITERLWILETVSLTQSLTWTHTCIISYFVILPALCNPTLTTFYKLYLSDFGIHQPVIPFNTFCHNFQFLSLWIPVKIFCLKFITNKALSRCIKGFLSY